MDLNDAPTLNSLNKPQKRALIMRDQLRFDEQHHLDSFIEGIAYVEPPAYKRINGTIFPALVMVTLKDTATRFDLGNVHFQNDIVLANGIYRAYLTFENGRFEIRTEDAMPSDENNLDSVPIHVFIAKNMVPMFENKFKSIYARMKQVNEVRQAAFDSVQKPVEQFQEGETLARLDTDHSAQDGHLSHAKKPRKRRPGEAVNKHASNKRKRIGLDVIPPDAKTATFDTIPEKIKVDLFDNVIKTALPNFDNLMIASWNVVSVYSNVGTDFPELHKAILELKSVLQDIEEGFGKNLSRKEPVVRSDFAPRAQDGANGVGSAIGFAGVDDATTGRRAIQALPEAIRDRSNNASATPPRGFDETLQREHDMDNIDNEDELDTSATEAQQNEMPPPNFKQIVKRHDDAASMDDDNDKRVLESQLKACANSTASRRASILRSTPEQHTRRPTESPLFEREQQTPTFSDASGLEKSRDVVSPELLRRREEYTSSNTLKPRTKPRNVPSRAVQSTYTSDILTPKFQSKSELRHITFGSFALQNLTSHATDSDEHLSSAQASRSNTPKEKRKPMAEMTTAELRSAYKKRKTELIQTFGGNSNVPQQYRVQMQKMMAEIKAREQAEAEVCEDDDEEAQQADGADGRRGRGSSKFDARFLGNSILGGKKTSSSGGMGVAPFAPMMHMRKESGTGGARREH